MNIAELEFLTQKAYLQTAASRTDSTVHVSPDLAYVRTKSSPDRWCNAVVRALQGPERFSELKIVTDEFDSLGINFNWHLWPSSNSELSSYLLNSVGMAAIGTCEFLLKEIGETTDFQSSRQIAPLLEADIDRYIDAKMTGWGNSPGYRPELYLAAKRLMNDPKSATFIVQERASVLGASSCYKEGVLAYLRGDFVVPAHRGKGLYKELILQREVELAKSGISWLSVIADQNSSSPIYRKLGYQKAGEIRVFARRPSSWLSL